MQRSGDAGPRRRRAGPRPLLLVLGIAALPVLLGAVAPGVGAGSTHAAPRVVYVTFSCDEGNFTCPGFKGALLRTGVSGRLLAPDPREDRVATLSLLAKQGYDLIIVDPDWVATLATVAPRFPRTRFAFFDGRLDWLPGRPRNVEGVVLEPHGAAFLAGWLATRMEQRRPGKDVVGVVGGRPAPQVEDLIAGYRAGARYASPKVTVLTDYSNDFLDPTKCEALARRQIARGAGVVFDVAGGCGVGTLRAAKAMSAWGIGVDTDRSSLGPHVLTSVVKGYEAGFLRLLRQVRGGKVRTGGTTVLTIRDGGAGLGRVSPRVPAALRAQLDHLRRRVVAGEVRVAGPS